MRAKQLRTPQELRRYQVALFFSCAAWVAILVSIVGALYAAFIALFVTLGHVMWLAHVRGNGVRIGPQQLPELWARVEAAATKLGMTKVPEVYVMQAGGLLNAFATKLFSRRFVIIYSDLIDACEAVTPSLGVPGSKPTELDFIIAHELGHLVLGHLNWWLLPSRIVPLLGPAYSRACEYSCDRCGHDVVGDIQTSTRALAILAGGRQVGRRLNIEAFAEQRQAAGGFWMSVYELNMSHPYLCKRVAALQTHATPHLVANVARNWAAYPLAPLFGGFIGGASAMATLAVLYLSIVAAMAIPAFKKYMDEARAAQLRHKAPPAEAMSADLLTGDNFSWTLKRPGPAWHLVPEAQARRTNALTDRWITRPDLDAHLMILAEVSRTRLEDAVATNIKNGSAATPSYELIRQTPFEFADGGTGVLIEAQLTIGEFDLSYLTAIRVTPTSVYQIVAFCKREQFAALRGEFEAALRSFSTTDAL